MSFMLSWMLESLEELIVCRYEHVHDYEYGVHSCKLILNEFCKLI